MDKAKVKKQAKEWGKAILVAFLIFLFIRSFLFEGFTIPSSSMEKTLLTGDFIIVSKLHYGARTPITPLSFPFSHQTLPFTSRTRSYLDWIRLPYWRTPGFSSIKQNDVIVFNYPMENEHPVDQRSFFIKRCIGLPGDSLRIVDGNVFVNGKPVDVPKTSESEYLAETDSVKIDSVKLVGWEVTEGGLEGHKGRYILNLTQTLADSVRKMKHVTSVEKVNEKRNLFTGELFSYHEDSLTHWNRDNYGPLYIPREGDTIVLSKRTLPAYARIISIYEKNKLVVRGDSIYINDKLTSRYALKMNYYFMMGDNRHNSNDSRFWGFVPEDHIVGKAVCVLFSVDQSRSWFSKLRWSRFFSGIK